MVGFTQCFMFVLMPAVSEGKVLPIVMYRDCVVVLDATVDTIRYITVASQPSQHLLCLFFGRSVFCAQCETLGDCWRQTDAL